MERLKKLWAKALRKVGVSITGQIYQIDLDAADFKLYVTGKRTAFLTHLINDFQNGDIIRLYERGPTGVRFPRREAHFFVKDVIKVKFEGITRKYQILTLE
jgi:hypothetical protein